MTKCVFFRQRTRPKSDVVMGFVFFNDFKWLQHHQRKAHFPLVFVFMPLAAESVGFRRRLLKTAFMCFSVISATRVAGAEESALAGLF
jgi:hypothetical protein